MSTAEQPAANNQNHQKRRQILTWLGALFLVIGVIWFLYWLIWARFEEYTDDAYVNGNLVRLMPRIRGTVVAIHTDDTDLVAEGQSVVSLDNTDTEIALQRAKANLALTVRQVHQYFEYAQQAEAAVAFRKADLIKADDDWKRRIGLVGKRAISREEMQHYKTRATTAKAQFDAARHQLQYALALIENSDLYHHPLVERAKENLKIAYLNNQRTIILAPITGIVAKRSVQVGQQIAPNTALLSIIPLNEVWVDANYKESQLSRLRIGQPVSVYADAYRFVYHGKIAGLNAGTGSAFALLPPQNATGNWIKIVQRLPVRISLDPEEIKKHPLQIGLSMHVTTNTHNLKNNALPQTPARGTPYMTRIYADQLAHANNLIDATLQANAPNIRMPT